MNAVQADAFVLHQLPEWLADCSINVLHQQMLSTNADIIQADALWSECCEPPARARGRGLPCLPGMQAVGSAEKFSNVLWLGCRVPATMVRMRTAITPTHLILPGVESPPHHT